MSEFRARSLGSRSNQGRRHRPRSNPLRRPYLEPLERRDLLTGSISLVDGVVIIEGTWADDTAVVTYDDRGTLLQINDDRVIVSLSHDGERHAEAFNMRRQVFDLQTRTFDWVRNVTRIVFNGSFGNDTFRNDSSLTASAFGGAGNDHLVGGSGTDILDGSYGNDNLEGRDGFDWLYGGDGDDTAYGGAGEDHLYGGSGNDWLLGGTGNDKLFGQEGSDLLAGEAGDDFLKGGSDGSEDILWGGTGADTFVMGYIWVGPLRLPGDWVQDFRPGEGDVLI